MTTLIATILTFIGCFIVVPIMLGLLRMFGFYVVVPERRCYVYVLFGKVVAVLDEPGLHSLWTKMGLRAPFINWIGRRYEIDLRSIAARRRGSSTIKDCPRSPCSRERRLLILRGASRGR